MVSCFDCFYCANGGGNLYVVCKFFNRVIKVNEKGWCSCYKGRNVKFGLKRSLK